MQLTYITEQYIIYTSFEDSLKMYNKYADRNIPKPFRAIILGRCGLFIVHTYRIVKQ